MINRINHSLLDTIINDLIVTFEWKGVYFFLYKLLFAGVIASGLGLLWDRLCFHWGLKERFRIGWFVPVGEECIKYWIATGWSLPVLGVYGIYGLFEGIYEAAGSGKKEVLKHLGAGVLTHLSFGIWYLGPFPRWLQFWSALVMHLIWNQFVLKKNNQA